MKKHLKKIAATMLAFLMIVSVLITSVPSANGFGIEADAASLNGTDHAGLSSQDLSIRSTNSFGNLLTGVLDSELKEQQENESVILSVEVEDTTATVGFQTLIDATIVVGIYDESGQHLLSSGYADVESTDTIASVAIETDTMPQYFYVKAYIIDTYSMRPICSVFESPMYTQEMQELLAMETTDFESDRVLNLDEQTETNFAVYSEETIVIPQSENNDVTYADDALGVYIIENADSSITSLVPGDIFVYEYEDGSVIIVKVASITMDGTTATITGEETSLEEVFDYVKVEAEAYTQDAVIDNSNLEEGVVFNGIVQDEVDGRTRSTNIEVSTSKSAEYEFVEKKIGADDDDDGIFQGSVTLSGTVKLNYTKSLKVYMSLSSQYIELKLDYSLKANVSVTGKVGVKIPLGYVRFTFPGGNLSFTPSFAVEVSGEISVSAGVTGTIGVKATDKGIENLTTRPKLEAEFKAELTVFVGLSLEPKLVIIDDELAEVKITAEVGGEAVAEKSFTASTNTSERHECAECIKGKIYSKYYLEFKVKLLDMKKLTFQKDFQIKDKMCDFYYSFDYNEFGWSKCPHMLYKTTIVIKDEKGNLLRNASVRVDGNYYTTDYSGVVKIYLGKGTHTVRFSQNNKTISNRFRISDKAQKAVVKLTSATLEVVDLQQYYSGFITASGDLYTWGRNYFGNLGDGTKTDRHVPTFIMSDVLDVSFGSAFCAAVTYAGELYIWGHMANSMEYGSTPAKIMDNISMVSCGPQYCAVVTNDGDLYTFGKNESGQLGDGTTTDRKTPVKILENVSSVSIGGAHGAALTNDGLLYMWGANSHGQIGDGTTADRMTPVKIANNITSISMGLSHSAAITSDGNLYMWGDNSSYGLGDGTKIDRHVPTKIMDNISAVSAGNDFSGAITCDGVLYMWGIDREGEVGDGDAYYNTVPVRIMDNVSYISLGDWHSAAITTDGSLYMWGANDFGQLGNGVTSDYCSTPTKITIPTASSLQFSLLQTIVSNAPSLTISAGTAAFADLAPNEIYNFYVMNDKGAEAPYTDTNLLYISQGVSDDNGELSFAYTPKSDDTNAEKFVVRMKDFDLSNAEVTVPNLSYTGEEQFVVPVVTLDGVILTEGVDYDLCDDYSATDCGEYTVTIRGKGVYHGETSVNYCVVAVTYSITPAIKGAASKLYEPWGLKYFASYDGDDVDKVTERGVVMLKDEFYTDGMTHEEFRANENAYDFSSARDELGFEAPSAKYPNGRYTALLDEGIYSYDISAAYYALPYAVMENGQIVYGTIRNISMEQVLNSNLSSSAVSAEEKTICTCILALKDSVATYYSATGIQGASIDIHAPRGSSQTAAEKVMTAAEAGITPAVKGAASRLIEPWGLKFTAAYTADSRIADRGIVMLREDSYSDTYASNQEAMRLNAEAYVFTEGDETLQYVASSDRYSALLTEGISSRDISAAYYAAPFVVLNDGTYVYGTVRSISMLNILNTNLSSSAVSAEEKAVCQDIIDLYNAVKAFYEAA